MRSTDSKTRLLYFFDLLLGAIFITSVQVMFDAATIDVNSTVALFFILLTRSRTGTCYDG